MMFGVQQVSALMGWRFCFSSGGGCVMPFFSLRGSSAADVSSLSPGLFSAPELFAPSLPVVCRAPVLEERRYHVLPFRTPQAPQI